MILASNPKLRVIPIFSAKTQEAMPYLYIISLLLLASSASGSRSLPPVDFLRTFMEQHSLYALEMRVPVSQISKSKLVTFYKSLEISPRTSVLDFRPSYMAQNKSSCTVLCRALHLLPPLTGYSQYIMDVFNTGARDHADEDFWLVGMLSKGQEGIREVRHLALIFLLALK